MATVALSLSREKLKIKKSQGELQNGIGMVSPLTTALSLRLFTPHGSWQKISGFKAGRRVYATCCNSPARNLLGVFSVIYGATEQSLLRYLVLSGHPGRRSRYRIFDGATICQRTWIKTAMR
jgi:hypothetical protein